MFMRSDSIHDAVLCAERRGRTSARSIDAAIIKDQDTAATIDWLMVLIDHAFISCLRSQTANSRMIFWVALRAFGKRDSTSAKTIRSKMRCLVSKVAPSVEKCREMTGRLVRAAT